MALSCACLVRRYVTIGYGFYFYARSLTALNTGPEGSARLSHHASPVESLPAARIDMLSDPQTLVPLNTGAPRAGVAI